MSKIAPCLWFNGQAEEAAEFYASILPDSRIDKIHRAAADNPSTPQGAVLTVEFTVAGQQFIGLNGGPDFTFSEAISFSIDCGDQAEVDRLWQKLTEGGGEPSVCGWLKDRYGVSWQVIPRRLTELLEAPDRDGAARVMKAMLEMTKIDVAKLEAAYAGASVAAAERPSESLRARLRSRADGQLQLNDVAQGEFFGMAHRVLDRHHVAPVLGEERGFEFDCRRCGR